MGLPALRTAALSLAKATLPDARALSRQAESVRAHLRRIGESLDLQNQCCEVKLRAERRIGELLLGKVKKGRPKWSHDATILADLGISKSQSSRWQLIARLPESIFDRHIQDAKDRKGELTTARVLKLAKQYVWQKRRQAGPETGGSIYTCDMLAIPVDDASVDLILTDPPYSNLDQYERLAEWAAEKLKPGGFCLAYCGQTYLPAVLAAMSALEYYWTFAVSFTGGRNCLIFPRNIQVHWKPIVAFCRPPATRHDWICDLLAGGSKRKLFTFGNSERVNPST